MHHFPRGEDKYSPLCENLQVYMSPSPPHISGNRACHQIIHHVLKILCTMTGVFLKNKKIAIWASHYRPSNLGVHSASLWKMCDWWWSRPESPLKARDQGQASHFGIATSWNWHPWNFQIILKPTFILRNVPWNILWVTEEITNLVIYYYY